MPRHSSFKASVTSHISVLVASRSSTHGGRAQTQVAFSAHRPRTGKGRAGPAV